MRKRVIISIVAVLVVALAGTVGWIASRPSANEGNHPASSLTVNEIVSVDVATVDTRELSRTSTLSGAVGPLHDVTAVSRVGGTVEWVVGDIGTRVQRGDPLVRIDDHDLRLQLKQAEASLTQAEAALERMHKGASEEERKQAQASVAQAEAGFELAAESYERAQFLFREGVIARDALDSAKSQYTMAQSQLEAAKQMWSQVERGVSAEEIRAAEAQVAQAEVAVEFAQKQLNDAVVKAPIDGHVAVRHTQVGSMLGAGSPVMTLVTIDEVMVQVGVNDRLVNGLQVGDAVTVHIQALPQRTFSGEIAAVSPIADQQTRLFPVRIKVDNADLLIKPGMIATIDFQIERTPPVPVVPQSAIVYKDGGAVVYVVRPDGRVDERAVTIGMANSGFVQVDGVEPGDQVVINRHGFLGDGVRVRIEREAR